MQINELGLYNSYGVWHVPFWHKPWFLYPVFGFALVTIALLIGYILKKYRSTRFKPAVSCWKEALDALHEIDKQPFDEQNGVVFYDTITVICKRYLSKRWNQDFCSATDQEVISWNEKIPSTPEQKAIINDLFSISSQTRFSQSYVSKERMKRDIEQCIIYVTQTTPHEQPR